MSRVLEAALALAVIAAAGCSGRAQQVDERLLLGLEEARAWQHRADLHLVDGDVAGATADVEHVLAISFPPQAPEAEEARLDAWARLARLHLGESDAAEERALGDIERGRAESTRDSFYRAHLETVAGEILEARAARLLPLDAARARLVRQQALAVYAQSISINQRVQARLQQGER